MEKTLFKKIRILDVLNYIVAVLVSSLSGYALSLMIPLNTFTSILYYMLFWFWWSHLARK